MHLFHCWHKIQGSERKLPWNNSHCKLLTDNGHYICGNEVWIEAQKQCCICGKIKTYNYTDYDIKRALQYPSKDKNE